MKTIAHVVKIKRKNECRASENFVLNFKDARTYKEHEQVVASMHSYLQSKKVLIESKVKDFSLGSSFIGRLVRSSRVALSGSELNLTTEKVKGTKVEIKYTAEDIKKIQGNWELLKNYAEVIHSLENSIVPQFEEMYKTVPGLEKYVENTKKFLADCKKSSSKLTKAITTDGAKNIPEGLDRVVNNLKIELEAKLEGRFEECSTHIYPNIVSIKDKNALAFFCYIQFTGLTDDEGWRKELFDVVVIAVPDERNELQYQIHTFENGNTLPNEIDLDSDWIRDLRGIKNRITSVLAERHALNVLRPQSITVTQKDVKNNKSLRLPEVKDVILEGQFLKIVLKASVRTKTQTMELGRKLHPLVKQFFNLSKKMNIVMKPIQGTTLTQWTLGFIVEAPVKSDPRWNYDRSILSEVSIGLNLSKEAEHALEDAYKKYLYRERNKKTQDTEFPSTVKDISTYVSNKNVENTEDDSDDSDEPISADRTKPSKKPPMIVRKPVTAPIGQPSKKKTSLQLQLEKRSTLFKSLEDEDIDL